VFVTAEFYDAADFAPAGYFAHACRGKKGVKCGRLEANALRLYLRGPGKIRDELRLSRAEVKYMKMLLYNNPFIFIWTKLLSLDQPSELEHACGDKR
jgi:hypothetical protein